MNKILIIAVHPDDETLGCGGTILKNKEQGNEVYWLIITKANQNITEINNILEIQQQYIKQVSEIYDFNGINQLDFITTELDKYSLGEIINEISSYIKLIKPNIIYFNHNADVHSDHRISFNAVYSCTKNFRFPFIEKLLLYETLSETEFAPSIECNTFTPNVFSDITKYLHKKLEIMKLYTTEQMEEPLPRSISTIEALARFRGSRIGVRYAEAFRLLFEKN